MSKVKFFSTLPKRFQRTNYPKYAYGSWIYTNNKQYLDFTSGLGNFLLGHNNKYININIINHLNTCKNYPHEIFNINSYSSLLTPQILSFLPNNKYDSIKYVSCDNVLNKAIELSKHFNGKNKVIHFIGEKNANKDIIYCQENMDQFNKILEKNQNNVSCIIIESNIENDVFSLNQQFVLELKKICKDNNILLISNETTSGLGRGDKYRNVEPDIILFGQSISNGYPLSSIISNKNITKYFNNISPEKSLTSLSFIAANSTLDIINKENLIYNSKNMGHYLKKELINIPYTKKINQNELFIGIEYFFSKDNPSKVIDLVNKLDDNGIIVLPSGKNSEFISILPPLNTNYKECDIFLEKYCEIMKNI